METYFENLPQVGDMRIEHTFYSYGEPILFVCVNNEMIRFLCSCCRLSEKWIFAQVSASELLKLISDEVTIHDTFENCRKTKFILTWDGQSFSMNGEVPTNILPKPGVFLNLTEEKNGSYKKMLESSSDGEDQLQFYFKHFATLQNQINTATHVLRAFVEQHSEEISQTMKIVQQSAEYFQAFAAYMESFKAYSAFSASIYNNQATCIDAPPEVVGEDTQEHQVNNTFLVRSSTSNEIAQASKYIDILGLAA